MLYRLRRHPWPVEAHFDECLVLAYAVPRAALEPLLPPGLTLDLHDDDGFLAIALVQTRGLRPVFLPRALGRDFFLSGYRIFAKHRSTDGHTRRGLRILRSDTDRQVMRFAGNLLTHYNYRVADVSIRREDATFEVQVRTPGGEADLHVRADLSTMPAPLPKTSPFRDLDEARRFAGPLPWTFDYERQTHSIVRIQGQRPIWNPQPVAVEVLQNTFLERSGLLEAGARLANAFYVKDIDYRWERGIREALPAAEQT